MIRRAGTRRRVGKWLLLYGEETETVDSGVGDLRLLYSDESIDLVLWMAWGGQVVS